MADDKEVKKGVIGDIEYATDNKDVVARMPIALFNRLIDLDEIISKTDFRLVSDHDLDRVLDMERELFSPDNSTKDPPETKEGLRRFQDQGGEIYWVYKPVGLFERIPLENLLNVDVKCLDKKSPFTQIAGRKDLIRRAIEAYSDKGKVPVYVHGLGALPRTKAENFGFFRNLNELMHLEIKANSRLYCAFVDYGPTSENINSPLFRLVLRRGAIIDGYEPQVYLSGVPYLRVSHGADYKLDEKDSVKVNLTKRTYKHETKEALSSGYLGTAIILDNNRAPKEMVFYKRLP